MPVGGLNLDDNEPEQEVPVQEVPEDPANVV